MKDSSKEEKDEEENEVELKFKKNKQKKLEDKENETKIEKDRAESKQGKSSELKKEETPSKDDKKPTFVAAKKFQGVKKGYVFRSGIQGVGYYEDAPPSSDKGAINAALASLTMSKKLGKSAKKKRRSV